MGKKIEMIGKKFGRLTVLEETNKRGVSGSIYYLCRCDCGNYRIVNGTGMRNGSSSSCGCYNKEIITKKDKIYNTNLYGVLNSMKQRCSNPKDKAYKNYGGRGIKVCDEWKNNSRTFFDWALKNGYVKGKWIDRINNDGNYEPNNCRWVYPSEQQNNKRTNHYLEINGIKKSLSQWAKEKNINRATLERRIELGWNTNDLFKPIDITKSHSEQIKFSLNPQKKIDI